MLIIQATHVPAPSIVKGKPQMASPVYSTNFNSPANRDECPYFSIM